MSVRYKSQLVGGNIAHLDHRIRLCLTIGPLETEIWVGLNIVELNWWRDISYGSDLTNAMIHQPVIYPNLVLDAGRVVWMESWDSGQRTLILPLQSKALKELAAGVALQIGLMISNNPLGIIGIHTGEWIDLRYVQQVETRIYSSSETPWLTPESRFSPYPSRLSIKAKCLDMDCLPSTLSHLSLDVDHLYGRWNTRVRTLSLPGTNDDVWSTSELTGIKELHVCTESINTLPEILPQNLTSLHCNVEKLSDYITLMSKIHPSCLLSQLVIQIKTPHDGVVTIPEGVESVTINTPHIHVGPHTHTVKYYCIPELERLPLSVHRIYIYGKHCHYLTAREGIDIYVQTTERCPPSHCTAQMQAAGYRLVTSKDSMCIYRI